MKTHYAIQNKYQEEGIDNLLFGIMGNDEFNSYKYRRNGTVCKEGTEKFCI